MNTFDYAVFIGRFQPLHIGHLHVFTQALQAAKQLLILVGSSGGARTLRNPFYFEERVAMMRAALPPALSARIHFLPLQDYTYNDAAWVNSVTHLVTQVIENDDKPRQKSVALVGHDKDETTYYLKLFPNWAYIEVSNLAGINATALRHDYLSSDNPRQFTSEVVPQPALAWLQQFADSDDFTALADEYAQVMREKCAWKNAPYPVIFTTTDALIRWHDEILLIRRKSPPGKGLLALPGGFLGTDETLLDGCLRELTEETQLDVDRATLSAALVNSAVFDDPKRSSRGRVITHCYYFDLSALAEKPRAQAGDDAQSLTWLNYQALEHAQLFEDHYFIIQNLLANHHKG